MNHGVLWISLKTPRHDKWACAKQTFALTSIIGVEISKCHIQKRCTRQPVLTAERNVKFPSSQTAPGQFTAESVTLNEDHPEDSKHTS
jgi:hypothetical protein